MLRASKYVDSAESLIRQIKEVSKRVPEIIEALERMESGDYKDSSTLTRDLSLLGFALRASMRAIAFRA